MGYAVEAGIFSAAEVGAPHIRKRLFILAYADSELVGKLADTVLDKRPDDVEAKQVPVGNTFGISGLDAAVLGRNGEAAGVFPPDAGDFDAWESWLRVWPDLQPAVLRNHPGLAHKVDRYRLTGNGVCPLAAGYAFGTLLAAARKRLKAA